jgi:hypothetical protein
MKKESPPYALTQLTCVLTCALTSVLTQLTGILTHNLNTTTEIALMHLNTVTSLVPRPYAVTIQERLPSGEAYAKNLLGAEACAEACAMAGC